MHYFETGAGGEFAECFAAKIESLETSVFCWIGWSGFVEHGANTRESGQFSYRTFCNACLTVPPIQPDIAAETAGDPMVGEIEDHGNADALEGEDHRFG